MFKRKSDGRYVERIEINGKRKEISAMTKKELTAKLVALREYEEKGPLFEDCADAWENYHTSQVADSSRQSYAPHVRRAKEYFSGEYMSDISPNDVQAYIDWTASQGFAKDTVRRALVTVNQIFRYAIIQPHSLVKFNPCESVSIPKKLSKTRREPPQKSMIEKITPDSPMGLFAFFMLYTGLRNGELMALRWEDIDRTNKLIHVTKSVEYLGDVPHVKQGAKTAAGVRDVPLLEVLEQVLPEGKKGYIFGNGEPMRKQEFYRAWADWCRSVGLAEEYVETHYSEGNKHTYHKYRYKPLFTPYQLRHEFASMLEESGVSEFDAMHAMGHSSIQVTKDVYTHIRDGKRQSNLANKMNSFISENNGQKE